MLFKKKKKKVFYQIAFCDENDLSTKFGEYYVKFDNYESAKWMILSKVNGWGYAIKYMENDSAKIDDAWLIIEKKEE